MNNVSSKTTALHKPNMRVFACACVCACVRVCVSWFPWLGLVYAMSLGTHILYECMYSNKLSAKS